MLRLGGDDIAIVVMPASGAALLGWVLDGTHILRPARPEAVMNGDVRGLSCFPLVPFCNRIANGRFVWRGVEYRLDRNFGDHPHAIHGLGWQRAWQVLSAS